MRKLNRIMFTADPIDKAFVKAFRKQARFNWWVTAFAVAIDLYIFVNEKEKIEMRKRIAELEESKGE